MAMSAPDDGLLLTKDEQKAMLAATWKVEKHEMDDGYITWEVWCCNPYWRICSLGEEDNPYARACADKIAAGHNAMMKE